MVRKKVPKSQKKAKKMSNIKKNRNKKRNQVKQKSTTVDKTSNKPKPRKMIIGATPGANFGMDGHAVTFLKDNPYAEWI